MQYPLKARIVEFKAPKKLVGLSVRTQPSDPAISELWEEFSAQRGEIPGVNGKTNYGLRLQVDDEILYIACAEVADLGSAPEGMTKRNLAPGTYALFNHRGPLSGLEETYARIRNEWLPQSGMQLQDLPWVEIYGNRYEPGSESSVMEIAVPVSTA